MKLFKNNVCLKYADSSEFEIKTQKGYFREYDKWSAIIMNFTNGVVLFQNPWAKNYMDANLISKIIRIDEFDLSCSWIDVDPKILEKKIELKIKDIENIYDAIVKY